MKSALELLGLILVVGGTAEVSLPAATILGGLLVVLMVNVPRPPGPPPAEGT